ncbi:TetR family transcriptional regulator [Tamilnaduibacter salinus]|uniref:TetR family transcriptional regulator n=1 Tax=Tamilnaduibacter salinus TaxID=1484056 RepID=A0A2A2I4B0_9GAMM|nr:TetR family transcriptional regulator [Tamilnaduibacter salinus]
MIENREVVKPYHHGHLREALIESARDILEREGRDLTLRAVAKRAGVSHTAPYKHFQSKDALLAAIAVQGFHELEYATRTARAEAGPCADDQLVATGLAYIFFGVQHPEVYRLMFGPRQTDAVSETVQAAGRSAFGVLVGVLENGIEAGVFNPTDPTTGAFAPWALVHGVTQMAIDRTGPLAATGHSAVERYARAALFSMLEGLRPRTETT